MCNGARRDSAYGRIRRVTAVVTLGAAGAAAWLTSAVAGAIPGHARTVERAAGDDRMATSEPCRDRVPGIVGGLGGDLGHVSSRGYPTQRRRDRDSAHIGFRTADEACPDRLGRFGGLDGFGGHPVRVREGFSVASGSDPEQWADIGWERGAVDRRPRQPGRQQPFGVGVFARDDAAHHEPFSDIVRGQRRAVPLSRDHRSEAAQPTAHDDHQAAGHHLGWDELTMTALRVEFDAIGTTACVVAERPADLIAARRALEIEIERIDLACSRFRPDSELARVHRSAGAPVPIGDALVEALRVAMHAADVTDGLVDPTVGAARA